MPLIKDTRKKRNKEYYTNPKVYDELEEITGLDHNTIKNIKSVADNIESSRRNDDLSFSHHVEVTKLEPEKQKDKFGRHKYETAFVSYK